VSTLEDLLRMKVDGFRAVDNKKINVTPDFRVAVQRVTDQGVHFIIHAAGFDSETLDFVAVGNTLYELGEDIHWDHENRCFVLIRDLPFL